MKFKLHKWFSNKSRSRRQSNRVQSRLRERFAFRAALEPLEDRHLLSTFAVLNLDDSGDGSLRQAIQDANDTPGADTIRFARGLSGTITTSSTLVITDDVKIDGPGAGRVTVSGGDAVRVFAVVPESLADSLHTTPSLDQLATSPNVAIEDLAVSDGLATDALGFDPDDASNPGFTFGGGIYNMGGTLKLTRVHMSGNQATGVVTAGGAVANEFGGVMEINRGVFTENSSNGFLIGVGGAVTSDLGPTTDGVATGQPNVTIAASRFTDNSATTQAGYIDGVGFSGLAAGGAILNVTGNMTISGSNFSGNSAEGGTGNAGSAEGGAAHGGAILTGDASPFGIAESTLTVRSSSFDGNSATGGEGGAKGVPGGQAYGGAISVGNGSEATLFQNRFRGNTAQGGDGTDDADGGLANGGAVAGVGLGELDLKRNTFIGNSADGGAGAGTGMGSVGQGGAIGLTSFAQAGFFPGSADATVHGDSYTNNTAMGGMGGAIFNDGTMTLANSRVTGNEAIGDADTLNAQIPGYVLKGAAMGGGIANAGTIHITHSHLANNRAIGADDAVGSNVLTLPEGVAPVYPGVAVGGGMFNAEIATVKNTKVANNRAVGGDDNSGSFAGMGTGGGIYSDFSLTVDRSWVYGNSAHGGDDNVGDLNAGGGFAGGLKSGSVRALADASRSASIEVTRTIVRNNSAVGGDGNQELFPVPVAGSAGTGWGGGIEVYQGEVKIHGSKFIGNHARGGDDAVGVGGGIFLFSFAGSVEASVSSTLVMRNSATGGDGSDGIGGGIFNGSLGSLFGSGGNVELNRVVVSHNTARGGSGGDGLGGGIYNDDGATVKAKRSLIFRNRALAGAGGDGVGGGLYNLGTEELIHSWIFANYATDSDDDCFGC